MIHEMRPEDVFGVSELERICFSDPWSLESVKEGLVSSLDTWLVLKEGGACLATASSGSLPGKENCFGSPFILSTGAGACQRNLWTVWWNIPEKRK